METKNENKAVALFKEELPQLQALLALNARAGTDVKTLALQELEYLGNVALAKPEILQCLPQSIIAAVKSALKKNLTLDPDAGLVYIKTRNLALEKDANGKVTKWGKVLEIQESANGLISVARQCGRIFDIKRPEVTKDASGRVIGVSVEVLLPSYPQPRWDRRDFDESDFERWRRASDKENGRGKTDGGAPGYKYANPNYTSWKGGIDPEFARAKAIRHGLKKLGTNTNERNAERIVVSAPKQVIVDPKADEAATGEEYHEYSEVGDSSQYHVETHEVVNIPNSNEL